MSTEIVSNVFRHSQQKSTKRLLLVVLADNAGESGIVWMFDEDLAVAANEDVARIPELLSEIESNGELRILDRGEESGLYAVTVGMPEDKARKALRFAQETRAKLVLPSLDAPGYVYLIRSVSGLYKIGRTKNPNDRLATFSVKLPFEIDFEHLIPCEDMCATEKVLHMKFEAKRINGEWFALNDEDVSYIKSLDGDA